MTKKIILETEKTVQQTLQDLAKLFRSLGVDGDSWMPLPDETGPGYSIKFLWQQKWVPVKSTLQPSRAGNIRMCYRALNFIHEMELRGITGVVSQTISEMGLVPMGSEEGFADESALLGVRNSASISEIRKAYKEKAQRFHPDHEGGDPDIFKAVTTAAEKLLKQKGEKL